MATARRIDRLRSVAAARQAGLTVVLEDIHDPHNAEAVFRSCDAFGVQQIHLVFEHEAPFKPRRVGKASSASANKWLSFTVHRSTAECLRALRASGHVLAAAAPPPQGGDLAATDLTAPRLALLFGNEHRGLSKEALAAADQVMSISIVGMVRSLNLSVAAAICLHEATRQRAATGCDYRLSADEQSRLVAEWLDRA
ncbi:MAG: RNA methyltransferase [Chloroflexi bacterium]|nr:RNA methyltransferase [Chloroflexota bacterium]